MKENRLTTVKWTEGNNKIIMHVHGGLNYIKGNSSPHFSITVDGYENGRESFGGCCHDLILQHCPQYADLVALHLSDIDGAPMHAFSNGWYWLAGAMGGAGERYHGGQTSSSPRTQADCLKVFADYCRISIEHAEAIKAECEAKYNYPDAKKHWSKICTGMYPRWEAEAKVAIAKYNLIVTGDEWVAA